VDARLTALEQYRLYVEVADRHNGRSMASHRFFLALNTALLTVVVTVMLSAYGRENAYLTGFLPLLGAGACLIWRKLAHATIRVGLVKRELIHKFEDALEFRPWQEERAILDHDEGYEEPAAVWLKVPAAFLLAHLAVLVYHGLEFLLSGM
jgi:hypothetical protein